MERFRIISKILLISHSVVTKKVYSDCISFPLGLAYLAGILNKNGLVVRILDCFIEDKFNLRSAENGWQEIGLSDKKIIEYINDFSPDLVGITISFSCQHLSVLKLVKLIKDSFPEIVIVVGGNHVSAIPKQINLNFIDYLVIGEGEYALVQLIRSLNDGETADNIPGVISKDASNYECPKYIENLDDLPFPSIELLPLRKYWNGRKRYINMIATRGCPHNCNFCSIHTVMGRKIRKRTVENVVAEIRYWKNIYNIQEIYFEDDNLTVCKQWAKDLFLKIAENNLGIQFFVRNGVRADSVDKEMLTLMKYAGFQDFWIAPESGSQKTLDEIIGKNIKLEDCTKVVRLANEVGIDVNAFFVIGFPEESWEDIEDTIKYARFLKHIGCRKFCLSLATPYPGTRLFKQCVKKEIIPRELDYRKLGTEESVINNEYLSTTDINVFRIKALEELLSGYSYRLGRFMRIFFLMTRPLFFLGMLKYMYKFYFFRINSFKLSYRKMNKFES